MKQVFMVLVEDVGEGDDSDQGVETVENPF